MLEHQGFLLKLICNYTVRDARPFALLRERILRPPTVAILDLKPCLLLRTILLGCQVLFIIHLRLFKFKSLELKLLTSSMGGAFYMSKLEMQEVDFAHSYLFTNSSFH